MNRAGTNALAALAWLLVWCFWLATTHRFHPTFALALIVTASLVGAYAIAACINHKVLIPNFLNSRQWLSYVVSLLAIMITFTAIALTIIRLAYLKMFGPDPDPNGVYKHFAIDFFGMAAHLVLAATVVRVFRTYTAARESP